MDWNGNTIDLLTDHRSLLYIGSIFCHSQVDSEFNSMHFGVSQQRLGELAIVWATLRSIV